ncbi:LacI family DNA-binding transcriptional regulator [Microvirga alba]|uniref:LacI family DNA-binding transcriptional regulator n=1 Tax=Microvirga alba TaxID=2791025 RepID=A0A931BQ81_9HYPH|nr:LacI family DNA-binding transcriptional regulator [Microvirga alba]MBF9235437.1 LacI family DNA-binding transcriptional regulator [Microvirga alba]
MRAPGEKQTRLKELAQELGLSITTVSRALAGYPDVSGKTRERVMQAAQAAQYVPSRAGRMLVSGRSDFVGMMLPIRGDIVDAFLGVFMTGLADGLAGHRRDLILATVSPGQDQLAVLRHLIDGQRVDALVINRLTRDDARIPFLLKRGFPFVAHGRVLTPTAPYPWVDTDGEKALFNLGNMLMDLGHQHIAVIGPTEPYTYAYFRKRGLMTAVEGRGLTIRPEALLEAQQGDKAATLQTAERLLDLVPRPTAIIGLTDILACAVLEAARRRGISVPDQLSVVGFDDVPIAAYADPPLSTFNQRGGEAAHIVADMIVACLEQGMEAVSPRLIEAEFVSRRSHGPAPSPRAR